MIVHSFLSFLAFLIYLGVGVYAYRLNSKSNVNEMFLLLCISMAIWSFAYTFAYLATNIYSFSFWNKISAFGWCTFSAIILYLTLHITKNKHSENKLVKFIIFTPAFVFLYIAMFLFYPGVQTNYMLEQFFYKGNFLYNFGYLLASILIICRWGRLSEDKSEKTQAKIIVITASIPFILNFITQYFLSFLGFKEIPLMGQIYMIITILGVYYTITRYGFMQITNSMLAEEMLTEVMDLTFLLDHEGKIIKVSKHTIDLLGYSLERLINKPITHVLKDNTIHEMYINKNWGTSVSKFEELQCSDNKGGLIPISVSCTPIIEPSSSRLLGILIVGQDIRTLKELNNEIRVHQETAKKLENSQEVFRIMVETIPLALMLIRKSDGNVIYLNKNVERIFRIKPDDMIGKITVNYYFNPEDRKKVISQVEELGIIRNKEVLFKKRTNECFWGSISVVKTIYNGEEVLLSCINDITKKKEVEDNLKHAKEEIEIINSELSERNSELIKMNLELQERSKRDSLTSLYNHQYINEKLENEIKRVKLLGKSLCVIMIDIDLFKRVNDTYGHQVGDWVIVTLCRILDNCTREIDIVGRYGGEEFIVVSPQASKEEALLIAECIRESVEKHIFDITDLRITVSIGLAEYEGEDDDAKAMVNRADILLYEAKKNGRNRVES